MFEDTQVPASVPDGVFSLIFWAVDGEYDHIQELSAAFTSNVAK